MYSQKIKLHFERPVILSAVSSHPVRISTTHLSDAAGSNILLRELEVEERKYIEDCLSIGGNVEEEECVGQKETQTNTNYI